MALERITVNGKALSEVLGKIEKQERADLRPPKAGGKHRNVSGAKSGKPRSVLEELREQIAGEQSSEHSTKIKQGLQKVRAQGRKLGRGRSVNRLQIVMLRNLGMSVRKIAAKLGYGIGSVDRVVKEYAKYSGALKKFWGAA